MTLAAVLGPAGGISSPLGRGPASVDRLPPRLQRRDTLWRAVADALRQADSVAEGGAGTSATAAAPAPAPEAAPCGEALAEGGSDCFICMDASPDIAVEPCGHELCFACACQLCARARGQLSCPFCRGAIASFRPVSGARQPEAGAAAC